MMGAGERKGFLVQYKELGVEAINVVTYAERGRVKGNSKRTQSENWG